MQNTGGSGRHRPLETFFCILAVVSFIVIVFAIGRTWGVEDGRNEVTAREHFESAKKNALRACAGIKGSAAIGCAVEAIEAAQERSESRQDLYAQQDAAKWSFWAMIATWVTLGVTALGVWFIKRTLDATFDAVREAAEGTRAAIIAAEAGREANRIAEQIGKVQTRPYLILDTRNIEVAIVQHGLSNVHVRVPMKNYGATPAFDPNISSNCRVFLKGGGGQSMYWESPLARSEEIGTTVAPGSEYRGIWTNTVVDINLSEPLWKHDRPQFSLSTEFRDPATYPIGVRVDLLFTYCDLNGEIMGKEYYRLDCRVETYGEFYKAKALRVQYDPQGAGDIYPLG